MPGDDDRRRRRPLPGEGSDRLGTYFDEGLAGGGGAPDETISYNVGGAGLGSLGQYVLELEAMAIEYRRNLEEGHIPTRYAVASWLALPTLRAFWPFSSINESNNPYDLSGQGRHLSRTGVTYGTSGLSGHVPIANFGPVNSSRFLSRADENGLNWDGLSAAMVVGWVFPGWQTQDFSYSPIVTKGDGDTGVEFGFHVRRNSMRVRVVAGSDVWLAPLSVSLNHNEWNFVAAGYHDGASLAKVFVNGVVEEHQGSFPSLSATSDPFYVGRYDDGMDTEWWDGLMAFVGFSGTLVATAVLETIYEGTRRAFGV